MKVNLQKEQNITLTKDDSSLQTKQTFWDIICTLCNRLLRRLIIWFLAPVALYMIDARTRAQEVFYICIFLIVSGSLFDITNIIWTKVKYGNIKLQEIPDFLLFEGRQIAGMWIVMPCLVVYFKMWCVFWRNVL